MNVSLNQFRFTRIALVWSLFLGLAFASCSKDNNSGGTTAADKTALKAAIAAAQALVDNTTEGTKPGQYEVGSKAALITALNASKTVDANADASQTSVNNATAQLQAAITAYQSHLIAEIAPTSLIGFWKMNGNPADSSGNGNNGVLTLGHPWFSENSTPVATPVLPTPVADRFGRAGMAYHFERGSNIEIPYKPAFNPQQMSISVWFKRAAGTTLNNDSRYIFSLNRWNGYKLQLQPDKLFLTVKHVNAGTGDPYYNRDDASFLATDDTWYHGVVTFKAGEMNFYVNGDLVQSWTDVPEAPVTLATPVNIVIGQDLPTSQYTLTDDGTGNTFVNWGGFWTGDLDDVMFYNIALTAPQVKSIYTNQKTL